MHDQLTDQILYGKYQIKYLEEEIIQEQRYRQRARREERDNHLKLMIFSALTILLGFIWSAFSGALGTVLCRKISQFSAAHFSVDFAAHPVFYGGFSGAQYFSFGEVCKADSWGCGLENLYL